MTITANPRVLPPHARQFSIRLDPHRPDGGIDGCGDVTMPPELHGAVPRRGLHFRAGRYCAIEALRLLEPERSVPTLPRDPNGAPVWPDGVTGSITHTDEFVSAAVVDASQARSVGIDSEPVIDADRARRVAVVVSWPCELALLRNAGFDRLVALTLVFAAKEAVFKCLHPLVGRIFGYHDVRVAGVDVANRTFTVRLVRTLSADYSAGTLLTGSFDVDDRGVHTGVVIPAGAAPARHER
jgi:enterobactin synthetase component D